MFWHYWFTSKFSKLLWTVLIFIRHLISPLVFSRGNDCSKLHPKSDFYKISFSDKLKLCFFSNRLRTYWAVPRKYAFLKHSTHTCVCMPWCLYEWVRYFRSEPLSYLTSGDRASVSSLKIGVENVNLLRTLF